MISRVSFRSFTLSLLPVIAVPAALSLMMPHQAVSSFDPGMSVLYQAPSPVMDPLRVRQLIRLRREIAACERQPTRHALPYTLHPNLTAEYRLIVRETTPEALRRAGLPFYVP